MATELMTAQARESVVPGDVERFHVFDEEITVNVSGADTDGAYAIVTISAAPGGGPPLHAHPGAETFTVLSGEFAMTRRDENGSTTFRATAGTVVHAPAGTPHRFENVSTTPSTLLAVFEPSVLDFLREVGATFPQGSQPDMEKMLDLSAKHQIDVFYDGEGIRPEPPRDGATSAEARALAWRFTHANDELIAAIQRCTPEQWRASCSDTGWSVAVQAHHVADNHAHLARMFQQIAQGASLPPMTTEMLDEVNARHAEAFANVSLSETIVLLRDNGAFAAQTYRSLTDEQLARTASLLAGGPPSTVAGLISYLAIGEIERHGAAIREVIGRRG